MKIKILISKFVLLSLTNLTNYKNKTMLEKAKDFGIEFLIILFSFIIAGYLNQTQNDFITFLIAFPIIISFDLIFIKLRSEKALQFYVFDEHTYYDKECIKLGMKPSYKDGRKTRIFTYREYKYIVLNRSDCYSGWEHTIMKLPQMNFEQLYNLSINTKSYEERVGAIGIILKYHKDEFYKIIEKIYNEKVYYDKRLKKICKMIFLEIEKRTDEVSEMKEILKLCYEIYKK